MTLKSFHHETASLLSVLRKGDRILAAGIVETREYNGKTYTDMLVDFVMPADMMPTSAGNASAPAADNGFLTEVADDAELPF
jgi:hypothetical protein